MRTCVPVLDLQSNWIFKQELFCAHILFVCCMRPPFHRSGPQESHLCLLQPYPGRFSPGGEQETETCRGAESRATFLGASEHF